MKKSVFALLVMISSMILISFTSCERRSGHRTPVTTEKAVVLEVQQGTINLRNEVIYKTKVRRLSQNTVYFINMTDTFAVNDTILVPR